jgi:putative glutamine amidotransferase
METTLCPPCLCGKSPGCFHSYNSDMRPRIALPVPHSRKPEHTQRSLPQYERAIEMAGGEPVRVALDRAPEEVARQIATCDAVLLPGSPADVDPQKYDAARDPHTAEPDPRRDMVDELLLQDAFNLHKPILGICYGLQSLNVWRTGTLRQHIEGTGIEHETGREVVDAHPVRLEPASRLAKLLAGQPEVRVNSSHHQSAETIGDGLRAVAHSPDGVVEAVEGVALDHFVLGVQWHPERTVDDDEHSRALFAALIAAAKEWHDRQAARNSEAPSERPTSR